MKSLKQLALLAFVRAVETSQYRRAGGGDYLQLDVGESDLLRAVCELLARRKKLSSSTLRPFLHLVTSLDLSSASPSLNLAQTVLRAPHLSVLAVRGRLTDAIVVHLPATLTVLDCSYCSRLTSVGLAGLVIACPGLVSLSCGWSNVGSIDDLCGLMHLDMLDASHLLHLRSVKKWPHNLQKLLLGGCSSLEHLDGWPAGLQQLELSDCGAALSCQPFPPGLCELALARVRQVDDDWLRERTALSRERLAWLDVSDTLVSGVVCSFPNLQSMLLDRCPVAPFDAVLPHLTVLSLSACPALPRDLFARLPRTCPSLTSLCLSSTDVSNEQLAPILRMPSLVRLDVSFCSHLSDPVLVMCGSLVLLRMYNCPNISLSALKSLAAKCPALRLCAPSSE